MMRRHALVVARLPVRRVPVWRRIVWPWRIVDLRRRDLPLPALFLDGDFGIDSPHVAFTLLVAFDKSIVLAEIVTHTGLPPTCGSLELVPRVVLFDEVVNLLQIHLASRSGRDGFMDEYDVVGCRALQLFFRVVFKAHLWRRRTSGLGGLRLLLLTRRTRAVGFLGRLPNIVFLPGI
jgi:hypothetical protein